MKYLYITFLIFLILSGCIDSTPQFNDPEPQNFTLDFNPLSFEVIKLWNEKNPDIQELQLDECNKATRRSQYTWLIELNPCVPVKEGA